MRISCRPSRETANKHIFKPGLNVNFLQKRLLRKAAAIKRFEYFPLRSKLKNNEKTIKDDEEPTIKNTIDQI